MLMTMTTLLLLLLMMISIIASGGGGGGGDDDDDDDPCESDHVRESGGVSTDWKGSRRWPWSGRIKRGLGGEGTKGVDGVRHINRKVMRQAQQLQPLGWNEVVINLNSPAIASSKVILRQLLF